MEAVIDAVRPAAETKQITIDATLDSISDQVLGDPDRLQQVASNLLSNAIKFSPRGGHIEVQLQQIESTIELRVKDNGDGISAEFLPHVFERFRQADSSSRRSHSGLGIGLAVVRHIAELHGGSVHAYSAGLRQGSTFVVTLPAFTGAGSVQGSALEHEGASASRERALSLEGLHVLIVDDDPDAREVLKEVLSNHHAKVTAVGSAQEALSALAAGTPDVLVSDVAMPGEDGYELIRRVRQRTPHEGGMIPALALTAYARKEDQARALAEGFQMHAAKPIEPSELIAAVATLAGTLLVRTGSTSSVPPKGWPTLEAPST
jgi:CheY-like chemotaxis protein